MSATLVHTPAQVTRGQVHGPCTLLAPSVTYDGIEWVKCKSVSGVLTHLIWITILNNAIIIDAIYH